VDILGNSIIQFLSELIIFSVATVIGVFVFNKVKNSDNRYLDIHEFLPEDEIFTLRQVYYLIMISACFIVVLYTFVVYNDYIYMVLFDVGLSLYIAITYEKSSLKNKVILFLLVPWGSLNYLMFGFSMVSLLDLIHVPIFIYFIKYYYDKFSEFTNSNGLGVSILLLFSIVFISFFVTQVVENANAVDSLVMVSNAFTSNGYAILGQSIPGKINSIFLVWGGYIISGAGTATLTAAILMRHFNKRFEQLEKLIDEGDEQ
jgi:hypothetical protein